MLHNSSNLESGNLSRIRKFNSTCDIMCQFGVGWCGGALLTEIFGITAANCMFKDSYDIMFKSIAGDHDLSLKEGNEQS